MRLRKNEINSKFSLTFLIYGINFDIYDTPKLIVYCFLYKSNLAQRRLNFSNRQSNYRFAFLRRGFFGSLR